MIIDATEREDFEQIIQSKGLDPSDFEIVPREEPMSGTEVQPIRRYVTVRRLSKGSHREYWAGHVSNWVAEFSQDLNQGLFG